jgi:hypothetical protein
VSSLPDLQVPYAAPFDSVETAQTPRPNSTSDSITDTCFDSSDCNVQTSPPKSTVSEDSTSSSSTSSSSSTNSQQETQPEDQLGFQTLPDISPVVGKFIIIVLFLSRFLNNFCLYCIFRSSSKIKTRSRKSLSHVFNNCYAKNNKVTKNTKENN